MENPHEPDTKKETERVELHYCRRCGALVVGAAQQPYCAACANVLRWLYQPRPTARPHKKGNSQWTY